ncbi:hypothetical protein BGZ60DRAFT_530225 [Tricladium varicosporioides]|nr:hypothetical protein BGZ60DRAFT_530225 [Hymenoscyphus varicosporioides]
MKSQITLLFLATQLIQVLGVPAEASKALAVSIAAPEDAIFKAPKVLAEGQSLSAEQQAARPVLESTAAMGSNAPIFLDLAVSA